MIGHYCPNIQRINIPTMSDKNNDGNKVEDKYPTTIFEAFQQFPSSSTFLSNLILLHVESAIPQPEFHYLLSQLQTARNLFYFCFRNPIHRYGNKLSTCLLRSLPFLQRLPINGRQTDAAFKLYSSQQPATGEYNFIEEKKAQKPPDPHWSDQVKILNQEEILRSLQHSQEEKDARWLPYYQFRRDVNNDGLDGRAAFFAALYQKLNDKERVRLSEWDNGNYTVNRQSMNK